jgi:hypothetical protein
MIFTSIICAEAMPAQNANVNAGMTSFLIVAMLRVFGPTCHGFLLLQRRLDCVSRVAFDLEHLRLRPSAGSFSADFSIP